MTILQVVKVVRSCSVYTRAQEQLKQQMTDNLLLIVLSSISFENKTPIQNSIFLLYKLPKIWTALKQYRLDNG